MSILKRARDILASNIYAKMDQVTDPEKEINQFMREIERDLREIKAETEAALVSRDRAKRSLEDCISEMEKMERYAVKALEVDDEEKARRFLTKKQTLSKDRQKLEKQFEISSIKVEQITLVQDKLEQDVEKLSTRRSELVSRLQVAESKKKAYEAGSTQSNVRLNAFDSLQEKAIRALDEAEALEQLRSGIDYDIEMLGQHSDNKN